MSAVCVGNMCRQYASAVCRYVLSICVDMCQYVSICVGMCRFVYQYVHRCIVSHLHGAKSIHDTPIIINNFRYYEIFKLRGAILQFNNYPQQFNILTFHRQQKGCCCVNTVTVTLQCLQYSTSTTAVKVKQ